MKIYKTRLGKITIRIIISCLILLVCVILFISPIAKYIVEKYDEKYLGRQITMDWIYVNPFTGFINIHNLKIFDSQSIDSTSNDSIAFSANSVKANFAVFKLLSKTIQISSITLVKPNGIVVQSGNKFNFDDLVHKFSSKTSDSIASKSGYQFNIYNIKVIEGEFYYREQKIPINYSIRKANLESKGKRWDSDSLSVLFNFHSGNGKGFADGDFMINLNNLDYRFDAVIKEFDLAILEQNLRAMSNYGHFIASLNADFIASGNFRDLEILDAKGLFELNDFHIGKKKGDDYAAFRKLSVQITELSPKNRLYLFDTISVSHPYFKYERFDYLDNLQRMFGEDGANIQASLATPARFNLVVAIAGYIKALAKNFFRSDFTINKLQVKDGCLEFNDHALNEKFAAKISPLEIDADSIDRKHERVGVILRAGIQPYGKVLLTLDINPRDSGDFEFRYHLQGVSMAMFNPYLISYTSFPLDRGTLELKGTWLVRNSMIKSENHLILIDPRITKRIRNKATKWIPLPLIMAFVRERGNVIDYEIPINGSLKDPAFNLKDVLQDLLSNIFVKPVTTAYRMQVKSVENEIEKTLTLKWPLRLGELDAKQIKFLGKMADFLADNPASSVDVYPMQFEDKEKEYIQLFEARKKYFQVKNHLNAKSLSQTDSIKVEKMSVKDSLFIHFLDAFGSNKSMFTNYEKCHNLVSEQAILALFEKLNKERWELFISCFPDKAVSQRIHRHKAVSTIPFNGYSYYKLSYKGTLPSSLLKAYEKMNDLNSESPRSRFRKYREKNNTRPD